MADEKPDEKAPVKNLHIEIPADLHQRIKLLCVLQSTSMKGYTQKALEEKVARDDEELKKGKSK